jgi:hypothetical protein
MHDFNYNIAPDFSLLSATFRNNSADHLHKTWTLNASNDAVLFTENFPRIAPACDKTVARNFTKSFRGLSDAKLIRR